MALYLPGDASKNVFTTENNIAFSGETTAAFLWRGKLPAANPSTAISLFYVNFAFYLEIAVNGVVAAQIRTTGENAITTVASGVVGSDAERTIFAKLESGNLIIYLDGTEVYNQPRSGGLLSTSQPLIIQGDTADGNDFTYTEVAYWFGTAPSLADIQAYPTLPLTSFSSSPTNRWALTGDGSIVSSLPDDNLSNALVQTSGPTTGDNAPTATNAVTPSPVTLTSIGGTALDGSTVVGFKTLDGLAYSKAISVSGTYTGDTPSGVQIRTIQIDGTQNSFRSVQSFTASANTWSGTIVLDVGDGVEYKEINDQTITEIGEITCCEEWLGIGQSNADGQIGADGQTMPTEYPVNAVFYRVDDNGVWTKNPSPDSGYFYQLTMARASILRGLPVVYTNQSIGGTSISTWINGGSSYTTMAANLTSSGMDESDTGRNVMWYQGESDSGTDADVYRSSLIQLKNTLKTDYGINKMFVVPVIKNDGGGHIGAIDAVSRDDDLLLGCYISDMQHGSETGGSDDIHVTDPKEAEIMAGRLSQSIAVYYAGLNLITVPPADVSYSDTVNISVSGTMPDGNYRTILTLDSGDVVHDGQLSFANGESSVAIPVVTGDVIRGVAEAANGTDVAPLKITVV